MQIVAAAGGAMAVLPIALGPGGAWIAVHVAGGLMALFALVVEGIRLPGRARALAAAGIAVSLAAIAVVTGGGEIARGVQVALLVVLVAIYAAVVFWRRRVD
jgi:hypothetical protein